MAIAISFTERSKLHGDRDYIPAVLAGEKAIMLVHQVELHPELATLFPSGTSIIPLASYPVLKPGDDEEHAYLVTVRGYRLEEFEAAVYELLHGRYGKFLELVEALQSEDEDGY